MRKKKLLTYGLLGVGAYLVYQHMKQAAPAPVVALPAPGAATGVSGFGYFPDGSDRPFAPRAGRYWRGRI
ncbi:MAG TPA: hypothetical protein VGQ73_02375 [Gemmatimonadales bacterium]|jgi:hypothetical protein|nr:hypothetical protein [Gemmatimonadales bacterium]